MKTSSRRPFHLRFVPLSAVAAAALAAGFVRPAAAQTVSAPAGANATVTPSGPRTGASGTNFLNLEGSGNTTFADFGVLDFSNSLLNPSAQTATAIQNNALTLTLTESNAAFTKPAALEFYLTTVTGQSISNAAGASSLKYQAGTATATTGAPYGIDPLLGALNGNANGSLYDLGSATFTSTGATGTGTVDTYTLSLGGAAAQAAFLNELNTAGGNVRLVAVSTTPAGAATFFGATTATAANKPTLSFAGTFVIPNGLYWQGGANGSWAPVGTTNWNPSNANPGTQAWDNGGTATAVFTTTSAGPVNINAGNINAAGLEFDTNGYTVNGTGAGNTLTLTGNHLVNVVNAGDTATLNAPVLGSVGLTKLGAGTLVLGSTANAFSGAVTISNGTLQISGDASLGNAANGIVLGGAGSTLAVPGSAPVALTFGAGRALSGTGTLNVPAGGTTTFNGPVTAGNLTLTNGGTLVLANTAGIANGQPSSNTIGVLTFGGATTVSAPNDPNTSNGLGVLTLGGVTMPSAVTGASAVNANVVFATGSTNTFNVAAANATLTIGGDLSGTGILAKTGSGTLVLTGANSNFTAAAPTQTTPNPATVRQGGAGATPADGGVISVVAGTALGTGQYQFNAGTLRNDSGGLLTFANSISVGAHDAPTSPGGAVFAGNGPITFTGVISTFQSGATAYAQTITVNTPTTFSGGFTAATSTGSGLTFAGGSTLLLNAATASTLAVPVTIANTGGTTAATAGTFGAAIRLTVATGSSLTINTGATGTVDTINDNGSVVLNGVAGSPGNFGKIVLTLAGSSETVGGLTLGAADTFTMNGTAVVLQPGLEPAGTYGAIGSGATYQSNDYFGGAGVLNNLATVPEPGTWGTIILGCLGLGAFARSRRVVKPGC